MACIHDETYSTVLDNREHWRNHSSFRKLLYEPERYHEHKMMEKSEFNF
ncbi:hypothetical protein AVEN_68356-1, partial [Araneus ventricosus]